MSWFNFILYPLLAAPICLVSWDLWRQRHLPRSFQFRPGTTLRITGQGKYNIFRIQSIQSQWGADGRRTYIVELTADPKS